MGNVKMCRTPRPRAGFTLVELLVVVGIIALLVGVLLPALSKVRETANRTKCLSNLRQIGLAVYMYTEDWHGLYPAAARYGPTQPDSGIHQSHVADFVYWEGSKPYWVRPNELALLPALTAAQDRDMGALVRYMGRHFDPTVWVCPDDQPEAHPLLQYTLLRYPYSYTMNYFFDQGLGLVNTGAAAYLNPRGVPLKSSRVRHPSECIVMLEEGPSTIDDGCTVIEFLGDAPAFTPGVGTPPKSALDWCAVRHGGLNGKPIHQPDNIVVTAVGETTIPNPAGRSNAAFADGHAETVTRQYVHDPLQRHWDPLH